MHICLVRHGEAEMRGSDDLRALTDGGRDEVDRVALAVASAGLRVERVVHSGKTRARETAEIFARRLGCRAIADPDGHLLSGASPMETARWIESFDSPRVLVSHLPLVERVAAILTTGSIDGPPLPFPPATCLWLESGQGSWRLRAHLTPQALGRL